MVVNIIWLDIAQAISINFILLNEILEYFITTENSFTVIMIRIQNSKDYNTIDVQNKFIRIYIGYGLCLIDIYN